MGRRICVSIGMAFVLQGKAIVMNVFLSNGSTHRIANAVARRFLKDMKIFIVVHAETPDVNSI